NDSSLFNEPETSEALGFGFRCGFLGLLHLEIVQERLERVHDLDLVTTAPSVDYKVWLTSGEQIEVDNTSMLPEPTGIERIEEPVIEARVIVPSKFVGPVMELCIQKRGEQTRMDYLTSDRVMLVYDLPLAEIVLDFYDRLKSVTSGYPSFDYDL